MDDTVGSVVRLIISDVAFGGKGVARHNGKVFFVPFTIPGEVVTARIVRQKKKFAEAELISVEQTSSDRVAPRCPYFGRCGGCSYQHVAYPRQLAIKPHQVEQTLRRVGRLQNVPMQPIIASPQEYEYRNRIRVHVIAGVAGFFAHESRALIDITECPISRPEVNEGLRRLRSGALVDGDYSIRAPGGKGPFFEQTNGDVALELARLIERTVRRDQELLIDAYCGSGLFAHHLAPLFGKVIGIEENSNAVANARRSADANEQYVCGDVEQHLGDVFSGLDAARTTVIIDPPAIGISARVLDLLIGHRPSEIVYVSCNPATLARDLAQLCASYQLQTVTPLDMFPQTAEIEVVAHLTV